MLNKVITTTLLGAGLLTLPFTSWGQENLGTLHRNLKVQEQPIAAPRPTALHLPFFDDFSYPGPYANPLLWKNRQVYINNHMSDDAITHGVATFDVWNEHGIPYDTTNRFATKWSDSLISNDIDLSGYTIADDLVLSFYVQQQGNGFMPHERDSIAVAFRNEIGTWVRMWANGVQTNSDYIHVRIRLEDAQYFHKSFAFAFINKGTKDINNSNWNIDYVFLNNNRNANTADINEVALLHAPTTLLKGYHQMPYSHYKQNPTKYFNTNLNIGIRNNTNNTQNIPYNFSINHGSNLLSQGAGNLTANTGNVAYTTLSGINNNYLDNITEDLFTIEGLFSIQDPTGQQANDTIIQKYPFAQEFAYDDGTPELSYFLNMHTSYNIPAMTAIAYELEQADTLRGFSVFFPQETPIQWNKEFSIKVYKSIEFGGGQDEELYTEQFIYPKFSDTVNQLVYYKLERPLALPQGQFYLTLVQPAGGFSDSLYVGYDIHTDSKEKRFYNTQGFWEASTLAGSVMFRPVVGKDFVLSTQDITQTTEAILYPNPTKDVLNIKANLSITSYMIYDTQGKMVLKSAVEHNQIPMANLPSGIYMIQLSTKEGSLPLLKIIKE